MHTLLVKVKLLFLYPSVAASCSALFCATLTHVFDWKLNCRGSSALFVPHYTGLKMEEQAKYGELGIACGFVKI